LDIIRQKKIPYYDVAVIQPFLLFGAAVKLLLLIPNWCVVF
jgi:hypothetical protein